VSACDFDCIKITGIHASHQRSFINLSLPLSHLDLI
jgi:hypothetical protein